MKRKRAVSLILSAVMAFTMAAVTLPAIPAMAASTGVTMHRLYNPNSGEHFYTKDESEKAGLVKEGWNDEGVGWIAPVTSKTPVYRLYNANAGDHHYTLKEAEKNNLISAGWNFEGIGWYSDDEESVPLYREYNPNAVSGTHNYTTDKAEHDGLVKAGWHDEGIGWYGIEEKKDDPTEPEDPTDPTNPTDPVDPVDPTDPTDPVDPTDPTEPEEPKDPKDMLFPNAKIGDYVTFGTYTQGRYVEDPATPIEWQYIANKDGHKMLLSKYVLDLGWYHRSYTGVTWENCDLRKWLNNDFYNAAFSASDKEKIVTAHNENPDTADLYGLREDGMGGQGGNPTDDKVFLLSWTEARDLFGAKLDYQEDWGNGYTEEDWAPGEVNTKLVCAPTAYAKARGVDTFELTNGAVSCPWYLRSPGQTNLYNIYYNTEATFVEPDGELDSVTVYDGGIGVRPVILID